MAVSPSAIPAAETKPSQGMAYPDAKGLWEQLRPGLEKRPDCANPMTEALRKFSETANEPDFLPFGPSQDADVKKAEECLKRAPAPAVRPGPAPSRAPAPSVPTWAWAVGGLAAVGVIVFVVTR